MGRVLYLDTLWWTLHSALEGRGREVPFLAHLHITHLPTFLCCSHTSLSFCLSAKSSREWENICFFSSHIFFAYHSHPRKKETPFRPSSPFATRFPFSWYRQMVAERRKGEKEIVFRKWNKGLSLSFSFARVGGNTIGCGHYRKSQVGHLIRGGLARSSSLPFPYS